MQKTTDELKVLFRDGARPIGQDFADLLDSVSNNADPFVLGDFTGSPTPGAMRYFGNKVQFFDAGIWKDVGGGTAFFAQATGTDINYANRVAIGFTPPGALTQPLEVGATNTAIMARVGRAITGGLDGGAGLGAVAIFSHQSHANVTDYAIAQDASGNTKINAAAGNTITFNVNNQAALAITDQRKVVVGDGVGAGNVTPLTMTPSPQLPDHPAATPLQLHVRGDAIKSNGSSSWAVGSDLRLKKDVSNFQDGLEKLRQVRPVRFAYNGKGFTTEGKDYIGIIGQELEQVFPYMIWKATGKLEADGPELDDLRIFDSGPLVFVLINAIKEMDEKLESLKKQLRTDDSTN